MRVGTTGKELSGSFSPSFGRSVCPAPARVQMKNSGLQDATAHIAEAATEVRSNTFKLRAFPFARKRTFRGQ